MTVRVIMIMCSAILCGCGPAAPIEKISDYDNPIVKEAARLIIKDAATREDKLKRIFFYVRDDIKFGFNRTYDFVKVSEVLREKIGYCNSKATLFLALCKAAGIPARIHCGTIRVDIMRGILPGYAVALSAEKGPHSWVKVEIGDTWKKLDAYIIDRDLFASSRKKLKEGISASDMEYPAVMENAGMITASTGIAL